MPELIPVLYGVNLLETGTVTVSGEAAGKPKERLFDRDIGLPWQDSSNSGTRTIKVDQGAGGTQAVSAWIIAAGHNLAGISLTLESSPDNAAWTVRDTFSPTGTVAFLRTISSLVVRYWRLQIPTPAAAPIVNEFFVTDGVALPKGPDPDSAVQGPVANTVRHESVGGYVWRASRGPTRWQAEYTLRHLTAAQRTTLETLYSTTLSGVSKLLWLTDVDSVLRWVEWNNPELDFRSIAILRHHLMLKFQEAL